MKYIYRINIFAIALPFAIALLGVADKSYLIYALFSTMLTGAIQVILAILAFIKYPKEMHLYIYSGITIFFFLLWHQYPNQDEIWILPPLLAIYHFCIMVILYKKQKDES